MPDALYNALYFPHSAVRPGSDGDTVVKRALLLWDTLAYMVPDKYYRPQFSDPLYDDAFELIGSPHVPEGEEMKRVHEQVEDLLARPKLPHVFYYNRASDGTYDSPEGYAIHSEKLLPET